jgi:hypothetical protein
LQKIGTFGIVTYDMGDEDPTEAWSKGQIT